MLEHFDLPPLKRMRYSNDILIKKAEILINKVANNLSLQINRTFDIQTTLFNPSQYKDEASSFHDIIQNLQAKFSTESRFDKRVALLTLLPKNWTYQKALEYFGCTHYMWKTSKRIQNTDGNMCQPKKRKTYNFISGEVQESIKNYYYENSRMCSGIKECIKVKVPGKESISLQKRVLLQNLKDLYNSWKETSNLDSYPSFSFFAELRPKECVLAGSPGTHTICVCPIHQNFKLKLYAAQCKLKTLDLIEKSVCAVDNEACMLRTCGKCSTDENKDKFRKVLIDQNIVKEGDITYKSWVQTKVCSTNDDGSSNRTCLETFKQSYDEFISELTDDMWELSVHHFIAENQKNYLSEAKQQLDSDTCLLMMDFAEKYAFIAQDSTQGFYFNNTTAVVHPIVMYYKDPSNKEKVKVQSFCIISNASKQTASTVNIFQEQVLNCINKDFSFIKKVIYFSDGCPTQYKNKNHLINIYHHMSDFQIEVKSYNFFSTSYGKNACDGVGAVAKRLVRRASLQNIYENHILNPMDMYDYLNENVKQIRFFFVDEKDVKTRDKKLKSRYESAKTIPDTRKKHCFIPIDKYNIKVKFS